MNLLLLILILVADLKALKLWDEVMVNDLKYFNGSVQPINRIPDAIKSNVMLPLLKLILLG